MVYMVHGIIMNLKLHTLSPCLIAEILWNSDSENNTVWKFPPANYLKAI